MGGGKDKQGEHESHEKGYSSDVGHEHGYPQQQGYPPLGYGPPPGAYPPQAYAPPPGAYPQGYPQQGYPQQGYPQQLNVQNGYPGSSSAPPLQSHESEHHGPNMKKLLIGGAMIAAAALGAPTMGMGMMGRGGFGGARGGRRRRRHDRRGRRGGYDSD